jgi:hypothetical protein
MVAIDDMGIIPGLQGKALPSGQKRLPLTSSPVAARDSSY